jgi:hypothetical protein
VSSPVDTFSLKSLSNGIYIYKIESEAFQRKNHKTIISNLPNECNYKTFNIKYPIIQAGMIWVSGHKLASAVSNAGGLGLIGAGSMYPEVLRTHSECKRNF